MSQNSQESTCGRDVFNLFYCYKEFNLVIKTFLRCLKDCKVYNAHSTYRRILTQPLIMSLKYVIHAILTSGYVTTSRHLLKFGTLFHRTSHLLRLIISDNTAYKFITTKGPLTAH